MKKASASKFVTERRLEEILDVAFAKLFGQIVAYVNLDKRFDEKADKAQVSSLITSVDGLVKRVDDDDTKRMANNAQLERHDHWIGELSASTGAQLSPP